MSKEPESTSRGQDRIDERFEVLSELLFVLLPLLVIATNRLFAGRGLASIVADTELSFIAAVLFGQAVAKCVSRALRTGMPVPQAVLAVSAIIVLGLVPSLMTLSWVLAANEAPEQLTSGMPSVLVESQAFLFGASILVYVFVASGFLLKGRGPAR
jgi:hypothetical protein